MAEGMEWNIVNIGKNIGLPDISPSVFIRHNRREFMSKAVSLAKKENYLKKKRNTYEKLFSDVQKRLKYKRGNRDLLQQEFMNMQVQGINISVMEDKFAEDVEKIPLTILKYCRPGIEKTLYFRNSNKLGGTLNREISTRIRLFTSKHSKLVSTFGNIYRPDDAKQYLIRNPILISEEGAMSLIMYGMLSSNRSSKLHEYIVLIRYMAEMGNVLQRPPISFIDIIVLEKRKWASEGLTYFELEADNMKKQIIEYAMDIDNARKSLNRLKYQEEKGLTVDITKDEISSLYESEDYKFFKTCILKQMREVRHYCDSDSDVISPFVVDVHIREMVKELEMQEHQITADDEINTSYNADDLDKTIVAEEDAYDDGALADIDEIGVHADEYENFDMDYSEEQIESEIIGYDEIDEYNIHAIDSDDDRLDREIRAYSAIDALHIDDDDYETSITYTDDDEDETTDEIIDYSEFDDYNNSITDSEVEALEREIGNCERIDIIDIEDDQYENFGTSDSEEYFERNAVTTVAAGLQKFSDTNINEDSDVGIFEETLTNANDDDDEDDDEDDDDDDEEEEEA